MFPSRIMVTTMTVAMTTVFLMPVMPMMPTMPVVTVMVMVAVMEQRIEGDEGGNWRYVVVPVMRVSRCAGQRQHDQAGSCHNSNLVYPLLSHFCLQSALMTGPL